MSTPPTSRDKSKFTLLLFASAQTYCSNTESLSLPAPMSLNELIDDLEKRWPGVSEKILKSSQIVINLDYIDWTWDERDVKGKEIQIVPGDEVGIVPPVSAG